MPKPTCSVANCTMPQRKRTWCNTHYARWYRNGHTGIEKVFGRQPCTVEGCSNFRDSHGYCTNHLRRWRRYGDPLGYYDSTAKMDNAVRTFWSKVEKTDGCWIWRGNLNPKGYGQTPNSLLPSSMVHRIAYILVKGPIADDPETGKTLELDHLCHTPACGLGDDCPHRSCVNPDHLEPVTHTENVRRGDRCGGRETCARGHSRAEFTVVNINGHKFCGECAREDDRKRYNAKKPRGPYRRRD